MASAKRNLPLFLSLALNLLLLGYVGAHWWRHERAADGGHGVQLVERLAAALPPADGERMRDALAARAAALSAAEAETEDAREAIRAALRREPFDTDALRSAMADFRRKRGRQQEHLQDVIAAAAAEMSHEGRARLANTRPHK